MIIDPVPFIHDTFFDVPDLADTNLSPVYGNLKFSFMICVIDSPQVYCRIHFNCP